SPQKFRAELLLLPRCPTPPPAQCPRHPCKFLLCCLPPSPAGEAECRRQSGLLLLPPPCVAGGSAGSPPPPIPAGPPPPSCCCSAIVATDAAVAVVAAVDAVAVSPSSRSRCPVPAKLPGVGVAPSSPQQSAHRGTPFRMFRRV
ncbi:unnamed protein product, partial [Ectocarpus fasciculatus]